MAVRAITQHLPNLYSLDLSFCSKITVSALFHLLEMRCGTLSELRLQSCRTLDIGRIVAERGRRSEGGYAGRQILSVLRSRASRSALSLLDVRYCGGEYTIKSGYAADDPFVVGMEGIGFCQRVPGLLVRPARWNMDFEKQLIDWILS
jgi:hypothetical protein